MAFSFSESRILFDSRDDGAEFSFEQFILTVTFALENVVLLHSPKDYAIDELVQRASVLTRTIAVCWNYYFVQNQSAKQRAGSACPKKHSMALCFFGVVNL